MIQRYIKPIDGKWYDVHVEFGEDDIGRVVDVKITDDMPDISECELIYSQH